KRLVQNISIGQANTSVISNEDSHGFDRPKGLRPMNRPDIVPEQLKERALADLPGSRSDDVEPGQPGKRRARPIWFWVLGLALAAAAGGFWSEFSHGGSSETAHASITPPQVTVSKPLLRDVDTQIGFLGQFSAVDYVELRAQV